MVTPIYLDHAATTPMHPAVIEAMTDTMKNVFGNPSSVHSYGRKAHECLEQARQTVADSLQVRPHEIIFTSGGTEGDNTAIVGTALSRQHIGKHIITTSIEHPAVLASMKYLESLGFEVTYVPVTAEGQIQLADIEQALREDTILVSIMFGNNETGNLLPISEVGELLREHPAYFHTDAVQVYGHLRIQPKELGIDLLTASGHKINGPKGVGFLYKSDEIQLPPFIHGGEQEEKRRAGTENLAGIVGMAAAASLATSEEIYRRQQLYLSFSEAIQRELTEAGIDFSVNGVSKQHLPHVLNLRFPGNNSDLLLMKLDLAGIAVSAGSACTAGSVEPSHVLEAMYGKGHPAIKESIRISFGLGNSLEDIEKLVQALKTIL